MKGRIGLIRWLSKYIVGLHSCSKCFQDFQIPHYPHSVPLQNWTSSLWFHNDQWGERWPTLPFEDFHSFLGVIYFFIDICCYKSTHTCKCILADFRLCCMSDIYCTFWLSSYMEYCAYQWNFIFIWPNWTKEYLVFHWTSNLRYRGHTINDAFGTFPLMLPQWYSCFNSG